MKSITCDYCGGEARMTSSKEVYDGRDYGPIYLCRPCNAYVGVHQGTDRPKGRLADADLRAWKIKAHAAFDPWWHYRIIELGYPKFRARNGAYKRLAKRMGIPREQCHIGMFDVAQCQLVVKICTETRAEKLWREEP